MKAFNLHIRKRMKKYIKKKRNDTGRKEKRLIDSEGGQSAMTGV